MTERFRESLIGEDINSPLLGDEPISKPRNHLTVIMALGAFFLAGLLLIPILNALSSDKSVIVDMLAINDVYELEPTAGRGGLARFATYAKELFNDNPSGFVTILPGDFYSPSALGFAPIKDKDGNNTPLLGAQMVDMFNYVADVTKSPSDSSPSLLATYGNHELDLKHADFTARVNESNFPYISSNLRYADGKAVEKTVPFLFMEKKGLRIAYLGVSTDMAQPTYIQIDDYDVSVDGLRKIIDGWKEAGEKWDILVALTHWNLSDDLALASDVPEIDLIMGGHEHENWYVDRGSATHPVIIAKADSNAKTVFHHRLAFDRKKADDAIKKLNDEKAGEGDKLKFGTAFHTGALKITSLLKSLDDSVKHEEKLQKRIEDWTERGYAAYRAADIDPSHPMALLPADMNILDKNVRYRQTSVGAFCADALSVSTQLPGEPNAPGIFNTGSLRIDDILAKGPVREYDALRMWAFGGGVFRLRLHGDLFLRFLNRGASYIGSGDYLGYSSSHISHDNKGNWIYRANSEEDFELVVPEGKYDVSVLEYMVKFTAKYFTKEEQDEIEFLPIPNDKIDCQRALIDHFADIYPIPKSILGLIPDHDEERITPFPRFKF